jgi:hypothetical protein
VLEPPFAHESLPETWRLALEEFIALPLTSPHRQRLTRAAAAIKLTLRDIVWLDSLVARHHYDDRRIAALLRRHFPGERWWLTELRAPRDLAYALRYIELATGQTLDPTRPLPWWVTEWTRR